MASATSHAQPPVDPQTDEPPPEYMQLISEAVEESVAEHWVEARSLFREAQRVFPNARALRGIGMTSFELRDYTAAHRALSASLEEPRRALDEEQRAQVEALLHRVTELIARYSVTHLGPEPVVVVDAVRQELDSDGVVLIPAGRHEVQVTLADGRRVRGSWTVRGGEVGPLPIEIPSEDLGPDSATRTPPEDLTTPTPLLQTPPATNLRPVGWALVAAGAASGIAGMAMSIVGRRDISLLEQPLSGTRWEDVSSLQTRGPRYVRTGTALVLLGAASMTTGLVLVLRSPSSSGPVRAQARLLPNGGRVEVTW